MAFLSDACTPLRPCTCHLGFREWPSLGPRLLTPEWEFPLHSPYPFSIHSVSTWAYFLHSITYAFIYMLFLFVCLFFYLTLHTMKRIRISGEQESYFSCSTAYLWSLKQCLACRMYLVNICEWINIITQSSLPFSIFETLSQNVRENVKFFPILYSISKAKC